MVGLDELEGLYQPRWFCDGPASSWSPKGITCMYKTQPHGCWKIILCHTSAQMTYKQTQTRQKIVLTTYVCSITSNKPAGLFSLLPGNVSNRAERFFPFFLSTNDPSALPEHDAFWPEAAIGCPPCSRAPPCLALPLFSQPSRWHLPKFSPVPSRARLCRQEGMPIHGGGAAWGLWGAKPSLTPLTLSYSACQCLSSAFFKKQPISTSSAPIRGDKSSVKITQWEGVAQHHVIF